MRVSNIVMLYYRHCYPGYFNLQPIVSMLVPDLAIKDVLGNLNRRGSGIPGPDYPTLKKFRSQDHILLNLGDGLVWDVGNGFSRKRGSFLLVREFFMVWGKILMLVK